MCYVASREGHLLDVLSFVHKDNLTPAPALLFHALIANIMILQGSIESLIDFFSFTVWIFYGMAMAALLMLRWKKPEIARPYKVPIVIPLIVLLFSAFLVIAPIVADPKLEYVYSIAFMAFGALLYVPFVTYKMKLPYVGKCTQKMQLLLKLVPPTTMPEC